MNALGSALSNAFERLSRAEFSDEDALLRVIKDVQTALLEADVKVTLVAQLTKDIKAALPAAGSNGTAVNRARVVERTLFEGLRKMLDPGTPPFKPKKKRSNVVLFVGLQGAGKTTTVAKVAAYYVARKWKVAMVCADTFRAGAFDQLKQNATKIRVPFYGSYTESDPAVIAREGVETFRAENYEIILVDSSGRHKQDAALWDEMRSINAAVRPDDTIFVMDGSIGQAAFAQAKAFKDSVNVGSVIITKLDGHSRGGGALSAVAATNSPIIFLGVGEGFEDLKPFEPIGFINKLLGKGDVGGLMNDFKERGILKQQEEFMEKVKAADGKVSLRDALEQLETLSGESGAGLANVMDMLPKNITAGMRAQGGGNPAADKSRVKSMRVLADSMTKAELDSNVEMTPARAHRILRGSGCLPQELDAFLNSRSHITNMMGSIAGSDMLSDEAALTRELKRNPAAVKEHLLQRFDAKMIESLGGIDALIEFMKDPSFDIDAQKSKKKAGGKK